MKPRPDAALALLLRGELRRRPARVLIGVVAIAVGVAMGYAVHLINHAALAEFSAAVRALMGHADVEIRAPRAGFDERLYPRVAGLAEVAAVSPVVEVEVALGGRHRSLRQPLRVLGLDVFRAAEVQPTLVGRLAEGGDRLALFAADTLFLSPAAMAWLQVAVGDRLTLRTGLDTVAVKVAGGLPLAGEGLRVGVMDIAAVQSHFDRLGVLHRLSVRLRPGVDAATFAARVGELLPAGVAVTTPEENVRRSANLSRAYRVNLNVLATVALFTGAFLVFTTQGLAVVRRRAQLALLRVLGASRAAVLRLIMAEGLLQGIAGAALGLVLGYAVAALFLRQFGGDLGGGFFEGVRPSLQFTVPAALLFLALGTAAALLGSLIPAWEAARAAPARALRAGDEESALRRLRRPWAGITLLILGAVLTLPGPVQGLPVYGYLAIACLLVGGILLMPWVTWRVLTALPRGWQPVPHLALSQLAATSGRAAIALGGIVASFSLMVAMAIMVASFRDSVERWLDHVLPADLYLRTSAVGESAFLSPEVQRAIARTRGVARAEFQRSTQVQLDPARPPVTLLARAVDAADPGARLALVGPPHVPRVGDPPPVWVSEAVVDLYGFKVGHRATLPLAGQAVEVLVSGVWRDYARQHGAIAMRLDDYRHLTGDAAVNDAALWLTHGTGAAEVTARLRAGIHGGGQMEIAAPGEIRVVSLAIFDRSFAVTYLLEAVAMVIGLFGIAASFGAQAMARAREFGMLRHLGMTRGQIGQLLALEGALLAALGCTVGLVLGWTIALVLIHVVNPQSFHWSMELSLPWKLLATVAAALMAAAALTALASGQRAMSRLAVHAVREDW